MFGHTIGSILGMRVGCGRRDCITPSDPNGSHWMEARVRTAASVPSRWMGCGVKLQVQKVSARALGGMERRATLLEKVADEAGRKWAERYRQVLLRDRRALTGGWPGTLTEARAVASKYLSTAVMSCSPLGPTAVERERLARMINASARRDWLESAARESSEPMGDEEE